MDTETTKVLVTALAGLVAGICLTLLSTWMTSRAADKKHQRDLRYRYLEISGRRRALAKAHDDELGTSEAEWLKHASADSVARMIGHMEKHCQIMEGLLERYESAQLEISKLQTQNDILRTKRDEALHHLERLRALADMANGEAAPEVRLPLTPQLLGAQEAKST